MEKYRYYTTNKGTSTCVNRIVNALTNQDEFVDLVLKYLENDFDESVYFDASVFTEDVKSEMRGRYHERYDSISHTLAFSLRHYYKDKITIKEDISPRRIDRNIMLVIPNFNSFMNLVYRINHNKLPETLYIKIYYECGEVGFGIASIFITDMQCASGLSEIVECDINSVARKRVADYIIKSIKSY